MTGSLAPSFPRGAGYLARRRLARVIHHQSASNGTEIHPPATTCMSSNQYLCRPRLKRYSLVTWTWHFGHFPFPFIRYHWSKQPRQQPQEYSQSPAQLALTRRALSSSEPGSRQICHHHAYTFASRRESDANTTTTRRQTQRNGRSQTRRPKVQRRRRGDDEEEA